ncbi:sugar diacid recognition domain-containing protein [Gorillibacterium sp. CAU 1737]|uniref:CdaR family transcriptional regulator n=1 Tax=Gorillibacterium sp. CAU 1737 TaxID=3140362 RepID=UPI003260EE03
MKLSRALGRRIAEEMMKVIPFNINVMDERGVIIGSGDSGRIGTLHRGAQKAIESGTLFEVGAEAEGMKPGVNEPIRFGERVIGVVGITGDPEVVRPFSKLVRAAAVLLIEQEKQNQRDQDERAQRALFFQELSARSTPYDEEFRQRALRYHIDLTRTVQVIAVEGNLGGKDLQRIVGVLSQWWVLMEQRAFLFLTDPSVSRKLVERLIECPDVLRLGIGSEEEMAAASLHHAELAIATGSGLDPDARVYAYESLKFLVHLTSKSQDASSGLIALLEQAGEKAGLVDTLRAYLTENGDHNRTVQRLNIHRNTLNYRLNRIEQLTGKNPRHFLDLFELLCGLIWREERPERG